VSFLSISVQDLGDDQILAEPLARRKSVTDVERHHLQLRLLRVVRRHQRDPHEAAGLSDKLFQSAATAGAAR
jgi:hypothetical protein